MEYTARPVIVDADALIALVDANDSHASEAVRVLNALIEIEAPLLYPATTIVEAVTTLQRKLSKPALVEQVTTSIQSGNFSIEPITEEIIAEATALFRPQGSKHNTLFDAVVAAVARQTDAQAIFSFDTWYKSQGFTLTSDLL